MSQELYYTSAPNGLKPGSKGFCTVAMTVGMSAAMVQRLELLSGYQELYPPGDPSAENNPVAWSHWRLSVDGRTQSVLSRVCSAGMDYTQRANVFAHHVVLDAADQCGGGPAWLMSQPGVMESRWTGSPRVLPSGRPVPKGEEPLRICSHWGSVAGDPGWGGVLAETARGENSRAAYVIYAPGTDVLALIREAMALLPAQQRWQVAFSTYFTDLPASLSCNWRCCVAGTAAAKEARRYATSGIVIDLTRLTGAAPDSPLVGAARTGQLSISEPTAVFEGAAAEAESPVASSRPAKRRLRAGPPEESESDGDQRWIPKATAALAEADDRANDQGEELRDGKSMRFWLVAILWPLVVIPGVVAFDLLYYKGSLQEENSQFQQTIQDVRQSLRVPNNADNSVLPKTIDDINAKIVELGKRNDMLNSDLVAFGGQLQHQNKLSTVLDEKLSDVKTQLSDLSKLVKELGEELSEVKTQLPELGKSIKDVTDKVSSVGGSATDISKALNDDFSDLKKTIKELDEKLDDVKKAIQSTTKGTGN